MFGRSEINLFLLAMFQVHYQVQTFLKSCWWALGVETAVDFSFNTALVAILAKTAGEFGILGNLLMNYFRSKSYKIHSRSKLQFTSAVI